MAIEEPDYPTRIRIEESESPSNAFLSRNRCCFNFPCFGPSAARLGGGGATSTTSNDDRWWARPLKAIKKLREWSEIVAGPKWKTFIRRFNRNHRNNRHYQAAGGGGGCGGGGKFQYDPLSYALNFDEGPAGQNGQFEEEYGQFPDFSSRFAPVPLSAKSSMDLGRGGAPAG